MVTRKFWPVHSAPVNHLNTAEAMLEVDRATAGRSVISDRCAQTIASWWHSPQSPYSTRLSTGGYVERYAAIGDFCPREEWAQYDQGERDALECLARYLEHYQSTAESGVRPCACDDCPDLVCGRTGELCASCADEGCDAEFSYSCERACPETDEV